jgi:anthranilate phosphoribosyltransferase
VESAAFSPFLQQVLCGEVLSDPEAERAMEAILQGAATPVQIAAFLVALRSRPVNAGELVGFARAMRGAMIRVDAGDGASLDTCGTGGDGAGTFNISTAAAFVIAGAGAKVAKHGNRSASSRCGSADVLEALGVRVDLTPERMGECIREIGIGFLFAPLLHPALRHAAPVRRELKVRTVMNVLGPMCNPAAATAQLVGVPSTEIGMAMAQALAQLDQGRRILVHASDGLDEVTTSGDTTVWIVDKGSVRNTLWNPAAFGVTSSPLSEIHGGDAEENARIIHTVLSGAHGAARDIVVLNAAAGLFALDASRSLAEHALDAARSIETGAAKRKLDELVRLTRESDLRS